MSSRLRSAACGVLVLAAGCASDLPPPAAVGATLPDAVVQYALESTPSGEVVRWRTAGSGVHGTVTPLRTFRAAAGFCRDYAVTLADSAGDGRVWQDRACRDGAGVWRAAALGA